MDARPHLPNRPHLNPNTNRHSEAAVARRTAGTPHSRNAQNGRKVARYVTPHVHRTRASIGMIGSANRSDSQQIRLTTLQSGGSWVSVQSTVTISLRGSSNGERPNHELPA